MALSKTTKPTVARLKKSQWRKDLSKVLEQPLFSKLYVAFAVVVVLATTLFWSLLSARLQSGNADQLVNADLFKNSSTFHNATFPSTHSFLLKWPIFLLIKLFGSSNTDFIVFTIIIVMLTIGGLLAIIHKIERRPLIFGTICLALASVLLLVPVQPYAGGIVPVNMAMLATRNVEYIVYILSLIIIIRCPKIKSWGFWLAVVCLSLLIASDKLFLILSVGGALIALIVYGGSRAWKLVTFSINWLSLSLFASILAIAVLALINATHLTHLTNQTSFGSYSLNGQASNVGLGIIYAVLGLFTNFGANPAFDSTAIKNIPHNLMNHLIGIGGPAYMVNIAILIFGLYVVASLIHKSWTNRRAKFQSDKASLLSIMLIWTTVVALISFIVTKHNYAIDARYLTIGLFAVFISIAAYVRSKRWQSELVVGSGLLIIIAIIFGLFMNSSIYTTDKNALATQNKHNATVAHVLARDPVDVLVGDYWRVLPINLVAQNKLTVMPLANCTQPQQILSSKSWQPDLHKHSFAYLLTLNGNLTNYPNCTLKQVVNNYGRPNTSVLISGTLIHPYELLLYYDKGILKSAPAISPPGTNPATVVPVSLSQLPYTNCDTATVMNIVAHEDDDILFMNPDLTHEIQAGYCIRTVYLTAGDAGKGEYYWLSREQGSEMAYDNMLGISQDTLWVQRIAELSDHEFIEVANPKGDSKHSLIFMKLPDGNLQGQGFIDSGFQSLAKLYKGSIKTINSVDNQSYYSSADLTAALSNLLDTYSATIINTQSDYNGAGIDHDHSDHLTVSLYVKQAYKQYETQAYANQVAIPIRFYIGYPVHQFAPNVSGNDLQQKEATFYDYIKNDFATCSSIQQCSLNSAYGIYLTREYQYSY